MSELVVDLPSQIVIPIYELEIVLATAIGTYFGISLFSYRYIAVRDGLVDEEGNCTDWRDLSIVEKFLAYSIATGLGLPLVVKSQREAEKKVEELENELGKYKARAMCCKSNVEDAEDDRDAE